MDPWKFKNYQNIIKILIVFKYLHALNQYYLAAENDEATSSKPQAEEIEDSRVEIDDLRRFSFVYPKNASGGDQKNFENITVERNIKTQNCTGAAPVFEYDSCRNGLYYYRARSYDPIMGRFLQTDPMGYQDSMNLYQAFNMNGINFFDPLGERIQFTGSNRKLDYILFKGIMRRIGIPYTDIEKYISKPDGEGFIYLKNPKGVLTSAVGKYHSADLKKSTFQGYIKWAKSTSELSSRSDIYSRSLMSIFEEIIDDPNTIIEFRTGKTVMKKSGREESVSGKYGGGVSLEKHETESGNVEVVVDYDYFRKDNKDISHRYPYTTVYNWNGKIKEGGALRYGVYETIVHEFGHAFASMMNFKSHRRKHNNMYCEIAVMMENLFRIRRDAKHLRPAHGSSSEAIYEENIYEKVDDEWVIKK